MLLTMQKQIFKNVRTVLNNSPISSMSWTFLRPYSNIDVPNWDKYRRPSSKNQEKMNKETIDLRRTTSSVLSLFGAVVTLYGVKTGVHHFVTSMSASADVLALAKIEVKLADIPEGRTLVLKWRGKPLFVTHRSEQQIKIERAVAVASLRDPQSDEERTIRPEWLVCIGVCTHLGCVPIPDLGDFPGGYYCPCHGSHYDGSGRIRKGPAPLNLEVPYYIFPDDNTLLVGN